MALLALDQVWKRFARGARGVRERVALRSVSLEVEPGELVAVLGRRGSGRSTLLEVAAGIYPPSAGSVSFEGRDLRDRSAIGAEHGIGYCTTGFARVIGETVLEHVAAPLLGGSASALHAHARGQEALRRVEAGSCAELEPRDLDPTETVRVSLARALIAEPRLLVIDEPTLGVRPRERDEVLGLLRSLAHDDGIAVLMTVEEATALAGADRALSIDAGELRGELVPASARVVPLHANRAGSSA